MSKYYIVSKKHTIPREEHITFYRPNHCGYTWYLSQAGVYAEDQLKGIPIGYDDDIETFAIPCEFVDEMVATVVPIGVNMKRLLEWKQ